MSNDKKKAAALPPKVASYIKESKQAITDLKKVAEAQQSRADGLQKEAEEHKAAQKKLAEETANQLLQRGVIAATHRAKFAEDLADPAKAHQLIRHLGAKVASAEQQAAPPRAGKPAEGAQRKSAQDGETAHDRFASRLRQTSGV